MSEGHRTPPSETPAPGLPSVCYVEITTRCNFRCIHCIRQKLPQQVGTAMSLEVFQRILGNLGFGGGFLPGLVFFGLGEPFTNPEFTAILSHARKTHPDLHMSFFTNFSLPTPADIATLVEIGVDEVIVSIETLDAESYRRVRQSDAFGRVLGSIAQLNEVKRLRSSARPACSVAWVVTSDTVADMPGAVAFAAKLGMYRVYFMSTYYLSDYDGPRVDLESPAFRAVLAAATKEAARLGIEVQFTGPREYEFRPCRFPTDQVNVAIDGSVYPCWFTLVNPRRASEKLGDLSRQRLDEIWGSEPFEALRRALASGSGVCSSCPLLFEGQRNVTIDLASFGPPR